MTTADSATRGAIFCATGEGYVALAARAAESVRRHAPDIEIDLYTDKPVDFPVFSRIHLLETPWHRSKLDAMASTRFERTLYLDADLFVVANIDDMFAVLERFDIAMAHDAERNSPLCFATWRKPLPASFPQFNAGVVAYRRTPEVIEFLRTWSRTVRENGHRFDQLSLRELVWDSDLRVAVLPEEFNMTQHGVLLTWGRTRPAPRIIHNPKLHHHFTGKSRRRIDTVEQLVGPAIAAMLPDLIAGDRYLARTEGREPYRPSHWRRRLVQLKVAAGLVRLGFDKALEDVGRLIGRKA